MPTLLLAEHDNTALKDATAKALTAAKALGAEVHILVAGHNCKGVAEAAAKLDGVKKVLLADAAAYEHMLAEPIAALIVSLAGPYETIMAAATTTGKNAMPRAPRGGSGNRRGGFGGADRTCRRRGRSRTVGFRRRGTFQIGATGADLGENHHFRRPGDAKPRELHQVYRAGGG